MMRMRSLSRDYRLQALSIPEIAGELERRVLDLSETHEFQGRKLKTGPALNAIVLHFLAQSEEAQRAMIEVYLPKLEAILRNDTSAAAKSAPPSAIVADDEAPDAAVGRVVQEEADPAPRSASRRRRGAG